ncbi:hypothetical protein HHI36_014315 [Cryptolaemus montrouzieri]|uniref:Protein msta n=1 Tax=Cryptolaemus montrouzieri TaxID=559131 RepID=A0ABD2N3G8_9CUCU
MSDNLCALCEKPAERKCSSCKFVHYCTVEHQKEHWKEHKKVCRPYEISTSEELGRHIVATRDLERGDVIFSEIPLIFGPKPHLIESGPVPCVGCCKILNQDIADQCEDCLWPCCSRECDGLKDPSRHALECKILRLRQGGIQSAKTFYDYFRFDILIILRALLLQKTNTEKWNQLMELEAHLGKRGQGSKIHRIIDEKVKYLQTHYLNPLKAYEQEIKKTIIPTVDTKTLHKIYGILDVNATELTDDIDAEILYLTASLIEHNCTPNTIQTIENANNKYRIIFRAALPIKKGEHITSMYTHILWGTISRREHLWERKYFRCTCNRCKDPTEFGTNLSGLKCMGTEKQPCGGLQLPVNPTEQNPSWTCDKCKISLPNEDVMEFVNHLGSEVDKILSKQPDLKELEDMLGKLLVFLHSNHYHVYTIKHSLVQLYGRNGQVTEDILMKKVEMCDELLGITKKLDPGNARLSMYLAVLLNELYMGKFGLLERKFTKDTKENFSEDVDNIKKILREASEALKYEIGSASGEKLNEVICMNEINFLKWMRENEMANK